MHRLGRKGTRLSPFGRSRELLRSILIVNSKEAISGGIKERSLEEDIGMLNN
jgi:hypothetical protein